jgi:hypothetical protein
MRGWMMSVGVLVLPLANARAQQDDARSLTAPRVAAQVTLGTLATPIGFFGTGLVASRLARALGADDDRVSRIANTAAYAGAALATSGASAAIGARGPGSGSYLAALGGAVAGGLASYGLVKLNDPTGDGRTTPCKLACVLSGIAVFVLPSAGATIGYNLSR